MADEKKKQTESSEIENSENKEALNKNMEKTDSKDNTEKKEPDFLQASKIDVAVYSSIFSILSVLPNIPKGNRFLGEHLKQIVSQYCSQIDISPLVAPIIERRVATFLVEEMILMPIEKSNDFQVNIVNSDMIKCMLASSFMFNISIVIALHLYKHLPYSKLPQFEKEVIKAIKEADKSEDTKEIMLLSAIEKTEKIEDSLLKEATTLFFKDLFAFSIDGKMMERYIMLHCYIVTFFIGKKLSSVKPF